MLQHFDVVCCSILTLYVAAFWRAGPRTLPADTLDCMSDDSTYLWSPGTSHISQFAGTQFAGNRRCILGQTSHAGTLGQTYMLAHWGKLHIQCILLIITPENVSADREFLIQTFLSISSHLYAFISCLYFPAVMYSASYSFTLLFCTALLRTWLLCTALLQL
jgi:hypothetical protein